MCPKWPYFKAAVCNILLNVTDVVRDISELLSALRDIIL